MKINDIINIKNWINHQFFFLKHNGIKKIINNKNFNIVIFYKIQKNLFHVHKSELVTTIANARRLPDIRDSKPRINLICRGNLENFLVKTAPIFYN